MYCIQFVVIWVMQIGQEYLLIGYVVDVGWIFDCVVIVSYVSFLLGMYGFCIVQIEIDGVVVGMVCWLFIDWCGYIEYLFIFEVQQLFFFVEYVWMCVYCGEQGVVEVMCGIYVVCFYGDVVEYVDILCGKLQC